MINPCFQHEQQQKIIQFLNVAPAFNLHHEIQFRIQFLKNYLKQTRKRTLVLGISGGIDSTLAGRLCQLAVEELRLEQYEAHFIAMRLPYDIQADEHEAQEALTFIKADRLMTINIKTASNSILSAITHEGLLSFAHEHEEDFILGNIKARQRMVVQYAVAGTTQGLVVGTDHAAEALMGFFTKFGDGACDIVPLYGLNKRRIRAIAQELGAPPALVHKKPTADLESLNPLRPDEEALGISYEEIDDFLEGKRMSEKVYEIIFSSYDASEHKRNLPVTPF